MDLAKDCLTEVWAGSRKLQGVMSCTEKNKRYAKKKSPENKTKQNRCQKENVRATLREEDTQAGNGERGKSKCQVWFLSPSPAWVSYSSLFLHFLSIGVNHQQSKGLKSFLDIICITPCRWRLGVKGEHLCLHTCLPQSKAISPGYILFKE